MKDPTAKTPVDAERSRALVLVARGGYARAEPMLEKLAKSMPRDGAVRHALGVAQSRRGRSEKALRTLATAKKLAPRRHEPHLEEAYVLRRLGRVEAAKRAIERACRLAPDDPLCLAYKAELLQMTGQGDKAWTLLEQLERERGLTGNAALVFADVALSRGCPERALPHVRAFLEQENLPPFEARNGLFRLAALLDRMAEHEAAFDAASQAHTRTPREHDPDAFSRAVDRLIGTWTAEALSGLPRGRDESELPVLVVGMPRSGTTLVEQIIAAHPSCGGAGELNAITLLAQDLQEDRSPLALVDRLDRITQAALDRGARSYLRRLREADRSAARVTDKFPQNLLHLGLASRLVPGCRIIHCRRDPLDTCVSCWFQNFVGAMPFVDDLTSLGRFHADCDRLIAHWREVLDRPILEVSYEDVVADVKEQARRIIDFLGLGWDDACLRFHETGRFVGTASNDQVRRPIYGSSVGRWKRYESRLGPLREALSR